MKRRLNLTIEEKLVARCKKYARTRGMSVSGLVEEALREMTAEQTSRFSQKWRGRFRPARRNGPRYDRLKKRYLS